MSPLYTQPALLFSGAFIILWFALQIPLRQAATQPSSTHPFFHLAVSGSMVSFFFLLLFLAGALGLMALAGKWLLHNWQA